MTVAVFRPKVEPMQDGITHAQAMEIGRRFFMDSDAAPTIAHAMGIAYETVCDSLAGNVWPGVRRYWMDRVFPS